MQWNRPLKGNYNVNDHRIWVCSHHFQAGFSDAFHNLPFRFDYETYTPHEQYLYELGRQIQKRTGLSEFHLTRAEEPLWLHLIYESAVQFSAAKPYAPEKSSFVDVLAHTMRLTPAPTYNMGTAR